MSPNRHDEWLGENGPKIVITGLRFVPPAPTFGETVDVRIRVENQGTGKGVDTVRCRAHARTGVEMVFFKSLVTQQGELNPGEQRVLSALWKPEEASFIVIAECRNNAETRSLTVGPVTPIGSPTSAAAAVAPPHGAHLRVICMAVAVPVLANVPCQLWAVVENAGDTDGQRQVATTVTGPSLFSGVQTVAVPAQEQRGISWMWQPPHEGTHHWVVEQMSADLQVLSHP